MLGTFINAMMSAEVDAVGGTEYGTRSETRNTSRNGYRPRDFDTRTKGPNERVRSAATEARLPEAVEGILSRGVP